MSTKQVNFIKGIRVVPTDDALTQEGQLSATITSPKLKTRIDGSEREILTSNQNQTLTNKTIDADLNTLSNIDNADIKSGAAIDASKLADGSVSNTEFQYLNSVTSNVQTQIDSKQPKALLDGKILIGNASNEAAEQSVTGDITITNAGVTSISSGVIVNADVNASAALDRSKLASGTAYRVLVNDISGVLSDNAAITASRALQSDANGLPTHSSVTSTELGYVSGVTSALQTQLNAKQSSSLTNGKILIGDISNLASEQTVSGDISISNTGVTSISSGVIVNADISASAAIDKSKLASGSAYRVAVSDVSGVLTENSAITASRAIVSDVNGLPTHSVATATEVSYLSGVTSNIQTQINSVSGLSSLTDGKFFIGNASNIPTEQTISGDITITNAGVANIAAGVIFNADLNSAAAIARSKLASGTAYRVSVNDGSGVLSDNAAITASRAIVSDVNGLPTHSVATATEVSYLSGVTSNIQTQINSMSGMPALPSSQIFVGNASNVATAVAMTGDIAITNAGVTSISSGVIVNADVNASAAIDRSKLASGNINRILINDGTGVMSENAALTSSRALISSGTGLISSSTVTATQLGYLSTTTSDVQVQIDAKLSPTLASGKIWVGSNISNATARTISGDISIDNVGVAAITSNSIVDADINSAAAIARSKLASGTANHVLINDGTGVMSSEATLAKSRGGSGQDNSSLTFPSSGTLLTNAIASSGVTSTKTANYTVTDSDNGKIIPVDLTSGSITIELHTPSINPFFITIKDLNGLAATNNLRINHDTVYIDSGPGLDKITENYGCTTLMYNGTQWYRIAYFNGNAPFSGKAVFGGGYTGTYSNVIDYVNIGALSNATDFGDLTVARLHCPGVASNTRGVFMGGTTASESNVMDYITIDTSGNATSFGTLAVARDGAGTVCSSTRGVMAGGQGGPTTVMVYITIATTGNDTSFGNLSVGRRDIAGCQSPTRGVFGAGAASNTMDYITIASTGNATNFGSMSVQRFDYGGLSNSTRGIFGGGDSGAASNVIDYITIATTGNATDFGDLSVTRTGVAGASNTIRGLFSGGYTGTYSNVIDYISINSTGNATDFGDLSVSRGTHGGLSNSHGGL